MLSLWDAAELDAASGDGEVAPTFINLGDASIQMVSFRFVLLALVKSAFTDQINWVYTRSRPYPREMKGCSHYKMF